MAQTQLTTNYKTQNYYTSVDPKYKWKETWRKLFKLKMVVKYEALELCSLDARLPSFKLSKFQYGEAASGIKTCVFKA